jgi:hypothetical protein
VLRYDLLRFSRDAFPPFQISNECAQQRWISELFSEGLCTGSWKLFSAFIFLFFLHFARYTYTTLKRVQVIISWQLRVITLSSYVGFEVLTEVVMNAAIFWDMTSCSSYVNRRFRGAYQLHIQGRKSVEQDTSMQQVARQHSNLVVGVKLPDLEFITSIPGNLEQPRERGNAYGRYSWGGRFESRPGHRMSRLFMDIAVPPGKCPEGTLIRPWELPSIHCRLFDCCVSYWLQLAQWYSNSCSLTSRCNFPSTLYLKVVDV